MGQFMTINLPKFTGTKVEEDPQELVDEIENIFKVMYVNGVEGVELAAYYLKDTVDQLYNEWEYSKSEHAEHTVWAKFEKVFVNRFFRLELRMAKDEEFKNLKQGKISGQPGHIQRECPVAKGNVGGAKSEANSSAPPPPQKGATSAAGKGCNRLYALKNRQEVEASPNIFTGMLQIFFGDIYVLLDLRSTLSYMTPYVAVGFGFKPDVIVEAFSVSTLVGDYVVAMRVYRNCVVTICG
ncbi:uncharacterized protein LOC124893094 [Capsicum annuum]|uniref:uncharacterized protein LOC124893094 n=1 Tax=Capsicum annuum TaxID=4072 RepID=UPI001FB144A9|nr:uncharacterized protein LOC124893094 [Capsicum annuum]